VGVGEVGTPVGVGVGELGKAVGVGVGPSVGVGVGPYVGVGVGDGEAVGIGPGLSSFMPVSARDLSSELLQASSEASNSRSPKSSLNSSSQSQQILS
jgi:hypothetical protein